MALKPITRQEQIIAGKELKPILRMERFLKEYGVAAYFGEFQTVVNEPLNITWDGNTEGLIGVVSPAGVKFFKVSDLVFTDEQIKTMSETLSNGNYVEYGEAWDAGIEEGLIIPGNDITVCCSIVVVRVDGAIVETDGVSYTFPEKGLYFMSVDGWAHVASLTSSENIEQTKTVVNKLDKKFLPDDVGGVFKVNISYDETNSAWICDKTYAEIKVAEESKMPITGTFTRKDGRVFTLIGCDDSINACYLVAFNVFEASYPYIYRITVMPDGYVRVYELSWEATATEAT